MAPSPDQDKSDDQDSSSSSSSSPPPPSSSPPPPSSSPPPPDQSSPPPPNNSSPPPPSSSPPPPSKDNDDNSSSSSPPPPKSSSSSKAPPPPKNGNTPSWKAPPPPSDSGTLAIGSSPDKSVTVDGKTALIAGVAVGGGLLLILLIVCILACCRKKKREKAHSQMNYFMDTEQADTNGFYNNGSSRYGGKLPPASSQYSSGQWLGAAPPPPPPGMTSSEIGSTNYSNQPPLPPPHPSLALGFNQSSFSYQDLASATGNFDKANLLGQGGFGYVHKGYLPNGKEIAVKSLKAGSGQGEREFQAEVDIISRVHHRHLVSLVGYCIADAQRMLVYEFVPNNSLEHHLYGKDQPVMDFPTRLKIALGAAKGFAYLHEDCHPRIIHRDIKAANILLDYNYEAKVADFGLAKLSNDTHTHVSTRIMGTFGYLAPEYASSGKLTEKSDVYSYGVVLLELITGKRPIDLSGVEEDSLVDWSRPILEQVTEGGSYEELVDTRLEDNYNPDEMLCMVACAAACIRQSARRRPRMSQVVRALEGDANLEDLNEAGRRDRSARLESHTSSDFDSYGSRVRMVRPRSGTIASSNEFTSSEHTSEYGIHASPTSSADSHEIRSNTSRRRTP